MGDTEMRGCPGNQLERGLLVVRMACREEGERGG